MERLLLRTVTRHALKCSPFWLRQSTSQWVTIATCKRFQSNEANANQANDQPITYTKSKAFSYKASENFRITKEEMTYPGYTSFIVKASVAIFLIYFCFIREPNDIDEMLSRDLFQIMPNLEIPMLESEVRRLEAHGINADDIKQKLEELKQLQ